MKSQIKDVNHVSTKTRTLAVFYCIGLHIVINRYPIIAASDLVRRNSVLNGISLIFLSLRSCLPFHVQDCPGYRCDTQHNESYLSRHKIAI